MTELEAAELHLKGGEYELCTNCRGSIIDLMERDSKCYYCERGVVPTKRYTEALQVLNVHRYKPTDEQISTAKYWDEWDQLMNAGIPSS